MAKGKFQNLTINYQQMLSMPVQDRINIAQSSDGKSMMSALTPTQYASLFPSYYKERAVLPNISGFDKSLTAEGASKIASSPTISPGSRSAPGGTAAPTALSKALPGAVARLAKKTGVDMSDPGAKAQLSTEKKEVFGRLKRGEVSSDDPSLRFLNELSADDLKAAGIQKNERDGKVTFSATATKASQMTDEEVRASASKQSVRPGVEGLNSGQAIRKEVYDAFKSTGLSDKQALALTAEVGRENGYNAKTIFGTHTDPGNKAKNIGMLSHQGPRYKEFVQYMQNAGVFDPDTGNLKPTKESLEAMARFYKQEMETKDEYRATRNAFLNNPDISREEAARILGDNYIRWARQGNSSGTFTKSDAMKHEAMRDRYYSEIQAINEKFPGSLAENATPQQIAQVRAELEKKENEGRELALAEKLVAKAPEGLDPKLTEAFNKMGSGQKQKFIQALEKDGAGSTDPTAAGVAKLNEAFKSDPQNTEARVQAGISQQGSTTLSFSDPTIAARAESLSDATKASLEKFKVFAPERTMVTSTYRSPTHPIEAAKRTPGTHSRGQAVDVRTNDKTKEELAGTIQALKKAGFNHILLEGDHIHAEVRPGQNEVNITNLGKGNPNIDLDTARGAAASAEYNIALNEAQEKKRQEQVALSKIEAEQRPVQQRGLLAYTGQKTSPEKAQLFEQQDSPQQVASLDVSKASQVEQTLIEQQAGGVPVQAFADGGEMNVNDGEISAQPINAIKGDNSVVVDGNKNPLFTMNTKEESANYDPGTGKVSVEPVSKNNPDELKAGAEKPAETGQSNDAERSQENVSQMSSKSSDLASTPNHSFESTSQLSANPIQSASFGRAMAATRMMKTSDGLGGHFDEGSTNLS